MQQVESQHFVGERGAWDLGSQLSGQRHPSPTTLAPPAGGGTPPEGHTRTKASRGYRICWFTQDPTCGTRPPVQHELSRHFACGANSRLSLRLFGFQKCACTSDDGGSADRGRLAAGSRPGIGFCSGLLQGGFLFRWDVVLLAFRLMHPCILLAAQFWLSLLVAAEVRCCWPGVLTCKRNTSESVGHNFTAMHVYTGFCAKRHRDSHRSSAEGSGTPTLRVSSGPLGSWFVAAWHIIFAF